MRKNILKKTIAMLIVAAFAAGLVSCAKNDSASKSDADIETAAAETYPENNVVAISEDGPMFPSLAIEIPTTEPIPDFIREGTEHWVMADIQERLMELDFMDWDEPTTYFGEGTKAAVIKFQRQNELTQDGVIGPDTLALLMSDGAKSYAAKKGDSGADIESIQWRLYQLGYVASRDMVTGNFGDKTEEAVKKFQEINGIAIDGTVGHQTYNLIYSEDVKANILIFGDSSDVVLAAQKRLADLGYLTTKPDGEYGADTVAAIKVFQAKNALVVDGYLGPGTREVLMSDAAVHNGLGLGDENEQVTKVQTLLAKYEYLKKGNVTGYFGEITLNAVKNFQKRNGLSADGVVGAQTLKKLTSENPKKAAKGDADKNQKTNNTTTTITTTAAASSGGTQQNSDAGSNQNVVITGSVPNTDANGVSSSVSALLAVARTKIGCRYSYGSKGPDRFDCSGFVYWCLNQVGVAQSYITSSGWRNVGKYTRISNYNDLRAGDIIVVNGHVGIISTGGYLIDASSSNGRVIERPLGSWWANHFIVGWRLF